MPVIFSDFVVILHLLFVAVAIGVSARLEMRFILNRHIPIQEADLADTHQSHNIVLAALVGLWCTGIVLIGLRTGFDLAQFSPKLFVKLIVVTVLSVNAMVIARFALPRLASAKGSLIHDIPLGQKLPLAICAATSLICWMAALALGSSQFLRSQSWDLLSLMLGVAFVFGFSVAILIATLCGPRAKNQSLDLGNEAGLIVLK